MMLSRFGIGARLFIAFLAITAVSLSSGVSSWLVLRDISEAQLRMNAEALPAVAATRRAADASAKLAAAAPALVASTDEVSRSRKDAALALLAEEIRQAVSDVGLSSLGRGSAARLSETADALISNLSDQSRLVRERLQLADLFSRRTERAIAAATSIVDVSETLVSNASAGASAVVANLYGLIDDQTRREEAYDALDRLIERDIYLLDRMSELRLRSSQIGLLANRLTRAIDGKEVAEIAAGYLEHLRVVRRRVAGIDDPVRRAQAEDLLRVLDASVGVSPWSESLFSQRLKLIAIGDELSRLTYANNELSSSVSQIAQAMLIQSEGFARSAAGQAAAAVETGLYALVASSLVAIFISGLIVWLYVERKVVKRLANLAGAMQRLTDGDLSVDVREEGTHELKALSRAVRAFRDESERRRALEDERGRTNEELRRHREDLRELVEERTRQLSDANLKLRLEVTRHAEARERAETASRAKSDFLAVMSHEIRTPMTGMLGMLRMLHDSSPNEGQRSQLSVAANSGEALLGILNSILDYSKTESGKIVVDPVTFSLREVLAGIVDLMRPSASEKGLKLTLSCNPEPRPGYVGDAGKIRQIVFNLVSNAIKFTEAGSISVSATEVSEDAMGRTVDIAVTDTGIGIAPGHQEQIFESFTQTDAAVTRRYGGTGLGLAISRNLAEALGGTLRVRSVPGEGSTFTLTLKLEKTDQESVTCVAGQVELQQGKGPLRILVVEDDTATGLVVQGFLQSMGHSVILAADGYEALSLAGSDPPDLIFMDISLPGMDGADTAQRIREMYGVGSVPIIAMSAHVFRDEVDHYLKTGMDGFVGKPLTPEMLATAIASVMGRASSGSTQQAINRAAFFSDLKSLGIETMQKILDAAEGVLPDRIREMREALGAGDYTRIARLAHATRSSAGSVGFPALFESAAALEEAARSGDATVICRLIAACEESYPAAIMEARRFIHDREVSCQANAGANR